MHVLTPKQGDPNLPFFFNVDGVVGALPAENRFEDVLFVQFCFKFAADHPTSVRSPELLAALRAVQVTGNCDAATINAIRLTQEGFKRRNPAAAVDGRVSPARGYIYGGGVWAIVHYNSILKNSTKAEWPRIDKVSGCPRRLADAVIRAVVGVD